MNYKKFLAAASAALMIVIVITLALAPAAWAQNKFKTLYKFQGGKNGAHPYSDLILDTAGNLYGTATGDGGYGSGVVFKLTPNPDGSWAESVLHSFKGKDGRSSAGLIFDGAGNLYGTCDGGIYGGGVVFELIPNANGSWKEKVLHQFTGGKDGGTPLAGLIFDGARNLYGTTYRAGGVHGGGVVFELIPNANGSWEEKVLHQFTGGKDGGNPLGGLIFDGAGNLYGTTYAGGVYGRGVVFELIPNANGSWKEKVLHQFTGGKDGGNPPAGLIFDGAGNLYGTTAAGGVYGGVVFELIPNANGSWKEKVLHQFTGGKDGGNPPAGLIFDGAGNLYGTTSLGGLYDLGVVFELAPNSNGGWKETVLHRFARQPGRPYAGLIFDAGGNLYGTTGGVGGSRSYGIVFEITP